MNSPLQFHAIHGEHIKLSKNNTVAKRVDSFCKGICFSNRPIRLREKIYVRILNKSVQWTGFLRLGMTTCNPSTHQTAAALPRHACPDLTCRPGYWAKCVPENCFDNNSKLTYFYVNEFGELFLNTPDGEISLLTGIIINEPLWALLDIYGNCTSIELVDVSPDRGNSLNDSMESSNATVSKDYFRNLRSDLIPVQFLPKHSRSISFTFGSGGNDGSIITFDRSENEGIVFFSRLLKANEAFLIKIMQTQYDGDHRSPGTKGFISTSLQLGLTNCDIHWLNENNALPLDIEQINHRSEFWIIQDFLQTEKTKLQNDDEFLFAFNADGVIKCSQNASKFQDFIHVDQTLSYYPFLVLRNQRITMRLLGYLTTLDKCSLLRQNDTALAHTVNTKQAEAMSKNSTEQSQQENVGRECAICMDKLRDTVLIPCGHICTCYQCAETLSTGSDRKCPICRRVVTLINKIFLS